jgi:hypothetical protein
LVVLRSGPGSSDLDVERNGRNEFQPYKKSLKINKLYKNNISGRQAKCKKCENWPGKLHEVRRPWLGRLAQVAARATRRLMSYDIKRDCRVPKPELLHPYPVNAELNPTSTIGP